MLQQIILPVALFAITATSVSAFNADKLQALDINLTDTEIAALEEARELRQDGDKEGAKDVLAEAGFDRDRLKEVRTAAKEARMEAREAIKATLEADDYDAFLEVATEKMLENITSEADFEKLVEAFELKEAGDTEGAKEIMEELGFEKPDHKKRGGHRGGGERQAE